VQAIFDYFLNHFFLNVHYGCYDDYAQCSNPLIITVHYSMFNLHSAHVLPKK